MAAFGVIVVFMVIEIVGGLISGSLALLADAAHMFADSAALGLAASAHIIARRPPDSKRHFGYQRMQVLAAFFNGATLIVLSLWIMVEAVGRFVAHVQGTSRASAATSASMSACACAALIVMRSRAVPSGTVGGRIAAT